MLRGSGGRALVWLRRELDRTSFDAVLAELVDEARSALGSLRAPQYPPTKFARIIEVAGIAAISTPPRKSR